MSQPCPLLSVVIPTLNRPVLLRETLSRILLHFPVGDARVNFVVVDNASDEPVAPLILDFLPLFLGSLTVSRFDSRVGIVKSFERSVGCASGKYVQIFGDDDLPCALVGFQLVDILEKLHPPLLYLNRFIGNSTLCDVREIAHPQDVAQSNRELSLSDFVSGYTHWPGFITSLVFDKMAWQSGASASKREYPGYTFLDYLYRSPLVNSVVIVGEPLIIQRRGIQTWKKFWPLYWYRGMGSLLYDLDNDNISHGALKHWLDTEVKLKNHIVDLLIARALPDIYDASFWREVKSLFRERSLFLFAVYLVGVLPSVLAIWLLSLSPNASKYGNLRAI